MNEPQPLENIPENSSFDDGRSRAARVVVKFFVYIGIAWGALGALAVADVQLRYLDYLVQNVEQAPAADVAIVLGASVKSNGDPSDALRDRLLVGQTLYQRKIVKKILITGDDGKYHADEIKVMRTFLVTRGVPVADILEDGHGYRTHESCKRAREVFGITNAIVVTQRFHLGRALYLCNRLGIEAWGVPSDLTTYQRILFFTLRDLAASLEAWIDVNLRPPEPPVEY